MRLNTDKKITAFREALVAGTSPIDLLGGKRQLQAMEQAAAEIHRIAALQKPQKQSLVRASNLKEILCKSLGVETIAEVQKALLAARRKRVFGSIARMLRRAAILEKNAAKRQAEMVVREAAQQAKAVTREAKKQAKMATRKAKRQAEKQAKAAAREAKKQAEKQAKAAAREAKKQAKAAAKEAEKQAKAAVSRAIKDVREVRERALARKDDARRKIIIGGTIITAILDNAPGGPALLEGLRARLGEAGWRSVEPIFTPSDDEKFLAEFLQGKPPDVAALAASGETGKGQLVKIYHETEAKIEKALDLTQTWNGVDQRRQRAMDARRKITVGGAVIAAIRAEDAAAPALLQLLDNRIGSTRDRETVRAILPIGEFRPVGRP